MSETGVSNQARVLAQAAAQRGEEFVEAVRMGYVFQIKDLLVAGSAAAYFFDMFGLELFRLDLRLNLPEEAGRLAPYDVQLEGEVALLELGVLEPLQLENTENKEPEHWRRLFGSSLLLSWQDEWRISEVLPFNSDGQLNPQDPADKFILDVYQGKQILPLQKQSLDESEWLFLREMQSQAGRFNLEELLNALRMWRDFKGKQETIDRTKIKTWAAGVEYLIAFFDYRLVDIDDIARRYGTTNRTILNRARELAQVLNTTEFDDRYSIHPDPIAHYRQIFGEIGVKPEKEEQKRLADERGKIFDTIEVPPDDEDFFGPG